MGQLIKIVDCISRYEQNIYLYPSRFVKLKKQQWELLLTRFEEEGKEYQLIEKEPAQYHKPRLKDKLLNIVKRNKETMIEEVAEEETNHNEESFSFTADYHVRPTSTKELKQMYLDQLFRTQLKWASSTLFSESSLPRSYYYNEQLKYLLQRFPDTFLVLFQPILKLGQAPVSLDTIVLTPTEVICLHFLDGAELTAYTGSAGRFWLAKKENEQKILNPLISLNRTVTVVKKILDKHDVTLPVQKVVLCREGYIDYPSVPFDVTLIDRKEYPSWFINQRQTKAPLKSQQLLAAQALLTYAERISFERSEWSDIGEG